MSLVYCRILGRTRLASLMTVAAAKLRTKSRSSLSNGRSFEIVF
jgi:hypothetical protein